MSNFSAISNLAAAVAGNTAATSALNSLGSSLTASTAAVAEAQTLLKKFQQAIEKTPPDTATANNALMLLATVQGLPSSVAPLIAELNDPAVQASPVTVAGIMAQIDAAFATATNKGILGGLLSKL